MVEFLSLATERGKGRGRREPRGDDLCSWQVEGGANASAPSPRMYLMRRMREGAKVSSYSGGQRGGGGKAAFRVPDKRELWPRVKKLGGIEGGGEREREQRVERGRRAGAEREEEREGEGGS